MAPRKKVTIEVAAGEDAKVNPSVSISNNPELQQILDHYGENSVEYAEAKAKAETE